MDAVVNATCVAASSSLASSLDPGVQWILILFLVCLSATFSGLTLGLMSLDPQGLQIVVEGGVGKYPQYAKKILTVRRRGNLLLCTLLLGNVAVNVLLPLIMADLTSGTIGFLASTAIIVVFGEIAPQAACSRHGLLIGAHMVWLVWFFIIILLPLSYPISKVLDRVLGVELGQSYNRKELKKLLELQVISDASDVTAEEQLILSGALDYAQKTVDEVMTPLDECFMVDIEEHPNLNEATLSMLMSSGYSRIPVIRGNNKQNVIGLLFVKDLVLLNPENEPPLEYALKLYRRALPRVFNDTHLNELLSQFKVGQSHMAIVQSVNTSGPGDPFYEIIGLITLEDIIEEILQDEILDETDQYVERRHVAATAETLVGPGTNSAMAVDVAEVLGGTVEEFHKDVVSEHVLQSLLTLSRTATLQKDTVLYRARQTSPYLSIILDGEFEFDVSEDEERPTPELSSSDKFPVLGVEALHMEQFAPWWTCTVASEQATVIRIHRSAYETAVKATLLNREVIRKRAITATEDTDVFTLN